MSPRGIWLAAAALSMSVVSAAAQPGATYVRTLEGVEWAAVALAYEPSLLALTLPGGGQCTLMLAQIDWEATARFNGAPLDLLRLPDQERQTPACGELADVSASDGGDSHGPPMPLSLPGSTPPGPSSPAGAAWTPPRDTERYRGIAVGTSARPLLDGVLDDAVWQAAIPFGEFFQQERHEGEPATEQTEIRVLYDQENIYFGIRAYDSEPDAVVAKNMIREGQLYSDDNVTILLDPLHDHRTAYLFGTNPNGMRVDWSLLGDSQRDLNRDWDGVWDAAAQRDAQGWTAELEIPFTTLRFYPRDIQTWGLAVRRRVARKNEPSTWPFIPNNSTFFRPSQAGHLDGLRAVRPGASLRLKPYVALGATRDFAGATGGRTREAGVDVRYWPIATLTTEFPVNTDFAQTEVDDVQINLTRFPLYYPEKRSFFLEGGQIFQFGIPREAELFFPRRIGLSADRRPIPIVAGGRVSGKVGRYYVGALGIRTAAEGAEAQADSLVLRAQRDIFSRSRIGGIYTEWRGRGGSYQRVVGGDAALYSGDAFSVNAFAATLIDPAMRTGTGAGSTAVGWNRDRWGVRVSYTSLGDNFQPELGFVPRAGMVCYVGVGRYSPRPRGLPWVRRLYVEPELRYHATQDGTPWTRLRSGSFRLELESGDDITVGFSDTYERLFVPFQIRTDQSIAPGAYPFRWGSVAVSTFDGRPIQGQLSVSTGGFYDGRRSDIEARGSLRFNEHVSLAPGLTHSRIDLSSGAFTAMILSTRVTYVFTPNLSVNTLLQWDSDTRQMVTNLRFNFIPRPGADFYVVSTEADALLDRLVPQSRSLIAKINYYWDF